jgi:16S rRNA processing protein RimM
MKPRYLLLGEILRPHGVQGELRMRILTDHPERITQLEKVYIGSDPNVTEATSYRVQHMRPHQGYGLLKLRGVDDRNQADLFRELFVMVALEDAVPLEEGEYYLYQLIGLNVQTEDGQLLGTLTDVLETGANDVYIVDSPQYGEVLIPVSDKTIIKTDVDNGIVIVHLPEGLIPSS